MTNGGWTEWEDFGRDYVLGRVCKMAGLARSLAEAKGERCITEETMREAVHRVILLAQRVIQRLKEKGRLEDQSDTPDLDWDVAFGRYCQDYDLG